MMDVPITLTATERFGSDEPAVYACLRAARGLHLTLRYAQGVCRFSRYPNEAWWGAKSYGASMELGGPWSQEFVYRLCELGLLSMDPQTATRAMLTKMGRAHLRSLNASPSPAEATARPLSAPDAGAGA